ncbi:MAG: cation:proton antiporter [Desulfobacterales bacterium]|nr:cation:proton antiporter [Desulfobacterales bacterium]
MDLHASVILVLALAVLGGLISSGLTKRMRGPQVLGYILAGVALGGQGINLIPIETVKTLTPVSFIALGIIGFLVGAELEFHELKKYARKFSTILVIEGLLASLLVALGSFAVVYYALDNFTYALVVGIVLGAISSATDPASTMGVIWEYRSAGILTTTLVAIVALDDVLAMALYGIASNVAQRLSGDGGSIMSSVLHFARDIGGAIVIGAVVGYGLVVFVRRRGNSENNLFVMIGAVLLSVGLAQTFHSDLILSAMTAGIIATNLAPQHVKHLMSQVRQVAVPIYILFFVLVGARLSLTGMPGWIWAVVIVYVVGRNGGKVVGAWIGARVSGAEPVVAANTGLGLFSQGGVAIGLAIVAGSHLNNIQLTEALTLGDAIVSIVTTTTFLIQLTGPAAVKWALVRAGETNRRLSAGDILAQHTAGGILESSFACKQSMSLEQVITNFGSHPEVESVAVLKKDDQFVGEISLRDLRPVLIEREMWPLIIADDVVNPQTETVSSDTSLDEATKIMENLGVEQLSVVDNGRFSGYLLRNKIRQLVKSKTLTASAA